jgi:alpha-tubulin suppressor-like RCC1 family protein
MARLLFVLPVFVGALATAIACGDGEDRPSFDGPNDAGLDAKPNLPDAAGASDGGADARPFDAADEPVSCAVTPCAMELTAGSDHFCARMSDGTVRCWGDGELGATGDVDGDAGDRPVIVPGLGAATQISTSERMSCARADDAGVQCWGANDQGQLGLNADPFVADDLPHPTPSRVDLPGPATRIDVGTRGACASLGSGEVWCWGANDRLQLARSTPDVIAGPARAALDGFVVSRTGLANGSGFALTNDARLIGWGAISGREGSLDPDPVPFPLPSLGNVSSLAVGTSHACAIANGKAHCWGQNRASSLCSGLPDDALLPTPTATTSSAFPQRIAVSDRTTCARMTDGSIQCCGDNTFGQLGSTTTTDPTRAVFDHASAFTKYAVQVAASSSTTCALVKDGSVECWGGNGHGELGQGTRDEAPHPTPVRVTF